MSSASSQKAKGSVLVVDDDQEIRLMAGEILRGAGFTVFAAEDAERCMKWLGVVQPSVILLDVNMPGTDGYVLCERIRAGFPQLGAAIVFVTSNRTADDVRMAKQVGGDYFVAKPYTADQLLDGIHKAFVMSRRR